MGIREQINENPSVVTGVTAGLLVLALVWMAFQLGLFGGGGGGRQPQVEYWQGDTNVRSGPYSLFERSNPADPNRPVIAHRAKSLTGGEPVIWYLERVAPTQGQRGVTATELRRPDMERWVPAQSAAGERIRSQPPRDAGGETMEPYYP